MHYNMEYSTLPPAVKNNWARLGGWGALLAGRPEFNMVAKESLRRTHTYASCEMLW